MGQQRPNSGQTLSKQWASNGQCGCCRVHREGESSARVERDSRFSHGRRDSADDSQRAELSHHAQKPPHRQAFDTYPQGGASQIQSQGEFAGSSIVLAVVK